MISLVSYNNNIIKNCNKQQTNNGSQTDSQIPNYHPRRPCSPSPGKPTHRKPGGLLTNIRYTQLYRQMWKKPKHGCRQARKEFLVLCLGEAVVSAVAILRLLWRCSLNLCCDPKVGHFVGVDVDDAQLQKASDNVEFAELGHRIHLLKASCTGEKPLKSLGF